MKERGAVHVFQPTYTQVGPDGLRRYKTAATWGYRFWFRGKEYQRSAGWSMKAEAREEGERHKAELVAGRLDDARTARFSGLVALIRAEYGLSCSPQTRTRLESALRHLEPFFGGDLVRDITYPRLLAYVAARQAEPCRGGLTSRGTIRQELAYLHRALVLARDAGAVQVVPRFPSLAVERRQGRFEPHELARLLAELPEWYRPLVEAADETGWRMQSELVPLTWAEVDFEHGWIRLPAERAKTRKARLFPFTARLRAILEAQRERARGLGRIVPWVFFRPDGRELGRYRSAWTDACRRAGLVGKRPHDLRRTAARRFDLAGLSQAAKLGIMGHDSSEQFSDYAYADAVTLRHAAEMLDAARGQEAAAPRVVGIEEGRKG